MTEQHQITFHPEKPKFGQPCNGCGFCCKNEVCKLGKDFYESDVVPCQGLRSDGKRYWCAVVEYAESIDMPLIGLALGIGVGCDSDGPNG